jgi:ABC-2 type transport system permease protein
MTSDQTVTYIWLGQSLFLLTLVGPDPDVASMIRSGNVAYELTKPIDLYGLWFTRAFGGRIMPLLMRGIPIFIVAGLFFRMQPPASLMAGTMFVVSLFGAFLLAASFVTLLTMSLLLTISGEGIARLAPAPNYFFSGVAVPLPLFPDWAQPLIALLPVRGLIDTPLRLYMDHLTGADALAALTHQFIWVVVFILLGRMLLMRLISRLIVQGG